MTDVTVNQLLSQPFGAADCLTLRHIYDWYPIIPEVLESTNCLRNRVAVNDLKSYLDAKNSGQKK